MEPITKYNKLVGLCRNATNSDGDRFVGIRVDTDKIEVCFPIGYHLPETDDEARSDIYGLIRVLSEFSPNKSSKLHLRGAETDSNVGFPIDAYLEIIRYYLEHHSYYHEKEPLFKTSDRGKTDWNKTIKDKKPILQADGSPVYLERIVRLSTPRDNQFITEIHKYCVYESFQKIGWLFTKYTPEKSSYKIEPRSAIIELKTKLSQTNDDKTRRLFSAMISMLLYTDKNTDKHQAYFGTDNFEYVWERVIDRIFGTDNKEAFFPKASWTIRGAQNRTFEALYPDTIMLDEENIYVLDAKYYRYGITNSIFHLPEGSSIHKHITYGEFISNDPKFINGKTGKHPTVYNAFLLPFDSRDYEKHVFYNFGEATGEWKTQERPYETVQGILMDTKYALKNYTGNNHQKKNVLASIIKEHFLQPLAP